MNVELVDKKFEKLKGITGEMFSAGAHLAYTRRRRHPSTKDYIFGKKNQIDIFDLKKTEESMKKALQFVQELGKEKKIILLVGTKPESRDVIRETGESLLLPYVSERWIGGLLTNWKEVKKRIDRFHEIREWKKTGEIEKFTKKEQTLIDKEESDLERNFGGVQDMKELPDALFVVDSLEEVTALKEAKVAKIPVISLSNSDCNINEIIYPIVANDASRKSITYFVGKIREAYKQGGESQ